MGIDEEYMSRALQLAELGRQKVSPNPMVGCVLVADGHIIGEGYHMKYGGPHAEVNAIASVSEAELLKNATMYVTLEPCSHFGKTPPCANLVIEKGIPKVVICNRDPNPLVSGKGIGLLKKAGIVVEEGVLEEYGIELNKRFFTSQGLHRPYVILKWAQTKDGYIARENFDSKWISDEYSRMLVHKWRSEEDAILVGTNTALYDNPSLNTRYWSGKSPLRIFLDKDLVVSQSSNLLDQSLPTVCYNFVKDGVDGHVQYVKLDFNKTIISQIMKDLGQKKVNSVIVEGGSRVLQSFIDTGYWDEARVFVSKEVYFGIGVPAPLLPMKQVFEEDLRGDTLKVFMN